VLTPDGRVYLAAQYRLYALPAASGLDTDAPWPMYRRDPRGTSCAQPPPGPPDEPCLTDQLPFANRVRICVQRTHPPVALELFRSAAPDPAAAVKVAEGRAGDSYVDDLTAPLGQPHYYWVRARGLGGVSELVGPVLQSAVDVQVRWFKPCPDWTNLPPAIAPDGTIYPAAVTNLYALWPDGTLKWQRDGLGCAPMVSPAGAIVVRRPDRVISLAPDGATNWVLSGLTDARSAPAIASDGSVIVPGVGGDVRCLTPAGNEKWRLTTGLFVAFSPSVSDEDEVALLVLNSQLLWLHPDGSRDVLLSLPNYYQNSAGPVLDAEGTAYLSPDTYLVANHKDGATKWSLASKGTVSPPAIGANNTVFVSYCPPIGTLCQATLAALNADGTVQWRYEVSASATSPALVADGTVLVSAGTTLHALDASDGSLRWQMESPNGAAAGAPIIDVDGTAYLPMKGGLLALELGSGPAAAPWPMYRQNARQSSCAARGHTPGLRLVQTPQTKLAVEVMGPAGAVLLRSSDLRRWERAGFLPAAAKPQAWPTTPGATMEFYRALPP
jgi:outer membrane protein assembly factor BamB